MSDLLNRRTLKLLKEGRDRIKHGWIQRQYTDGNGNYCSLGAIYASEENMQIRNLAELYLFQAVPEVFQSCCEGVVGFNDHPATRKQNVIAVFDRAIAMLEEGIKPTVPDHFAVMDLFSAIWEEKSQKEDQEVAEVEDRELVLA